MHPLKHYYLNLFGIEIWNLRRICSDEFYLYELARANQPNAFLLVDGEFLQVENKAFPLIHSMLRAFNLDIQDKRTKLSLSELNHLESYKEIIMFTKFASLNKVEDLRSRSSRFVYCDPLQLLASPLEKKDFWREIRNFTC